MDGDSLRFGSSLPVVSSGFNLVCLWESDMYRILVAADRGAIL